MLRYVKKLSPIWSAVVGALALVAGGLSLAGWDRAQAQTAPARPVAQTPASAAMDQQLRTQIQPFLQAHCYKCHANGKHRGDITLDKFTNFAAVQQDLDTWQQVRDALAQHEMPPEKEPQPPANQLATLANFASKAVDFIDPSVPIDPGFVAIHRLNRNEYNNTIRDLVGVDFHPADDFPADDTGYGFDNIADVLSMSPLLAEKYLAAAEQVMDKAIVLESPHKPKITRYLAEHMKGGDVTAGARGLYTNGQITQEHKFVAAAEYEFRIEAEEDPAGKDPAKMLVSIDGKEITTVNVTNRRGRPKVYTFRTKAGSGTHQISMAFINDFYDPEAKDPKRRDRNLYIDTLEIEGPFGLGPPPASDIQKKLLFVGPADGSAGETCATQVLRSFATRAFRRPASSEEISRLVNLYKTGRLQGESYEQACKFAMTAVLVSPQFLYRIESDPVGPAVPHPINDFELASRLSYFLWSSMPDDALLEAAGQNRLHQPLVLDAQVKRMLSDPKSDAFVRNFAGQWLELRNLAQSSPDPKVFPKFDHRLRDDFRQEGELFFANIVKQDRSVLELLDANYTFLNERLANFYGIDGVTGDEFRRVEFTPEQCKRRGGVLTMAGVLTVTALPNRTAPMRRGKFILDQILGTPIPPPPPDVPPLQESTHNTKAMSLRQRLEEHRANPACASCHVKLDPLGFALENFDAIGRWRDKDAGVPIDSSGKLPTGEAIDGAQSLRKLLVAHHDQFVRSLISKLMTYGLGRGTNSSDSILVRQIEKTAEKDGCRFSSIIAGIVHSDAFLKRRAKI